MLDFLKGINLQGEKETRDLYELFKTESLDLNSKFLTKIDKYKTLSEFFDNYSKLHVRNVLYIFENLESLPAIISENQNEKIKNNTIDKYLFDITKVILFLWIIEKTNETLNNFINKAKDFLNKFNSKEENSLLSEKINNCLKNIFDSSTFLHQRTQSRRITKETSPRSNINNIENKRNSVMTNVSSDITELLILDNDTPRFEDNKNHNNSSKDKKDGSEVKDSGKTIDSIFSLKNMKFIYDTSDINLRGGKKNRTIKFGFDKQNTKLFFKQKSKSNHQENSSKINGLDSNNEYNLNSLDKSQILADLLNIINYLFENNKINSEQKLLLKQLLISDTDNFIKRLFKFNESNFPFNANLKSVFKIFLISELKNI